MTNGLKSWAASRANPLEQLMEGNRRFVEATPLHPHQAPGHREILVEGQMPFAAIVGCADSRVAPEILFDQGLGDLFVMRTAGNVLHEYVLASLEFAVLALKVPCVMVLGHSHCGAIKAVAEGQAITEHLAQLASIIQPAVDEATNEPGDLLINASRLNARMVAAQLIRRSPVLAQAVEENKLQITAAFYHLTTGAVEILEERVTAPYR